MELEIEGGDDDRTVLPQETPLSRDRLSRKEPFRADSSLNGEDKSSISIPPVAYNDKGEAITHPPSSISHQSNKLDPAN